jgi:glycerol-3-phosphate acyltransferase PlsY
MFWLLVALGYFLGSVPTAYLAGRMLKGVDIRQIGDGNMGAANACRQLGPEVGFMVGIADAAKGALAVITVPMLIVAAPAVLAHFILRDTTKAAAVIFVPLPFLC